MTEISKSQNYLNTVLAAAKDKRTADKVTVSDKRIEEALAYRDALKTINQGEATAAQARLIAMWWLYQRVELVGEYNDFTSFINQEILVGDVVNRRSIQAATNITTSILQWVHANKPVIAGKSVTVNDILNREGLDAKLRNVLALFKAGDDETKKQLVDAVLTQTQDQLRNTVNEVRKALGKQLLTGSNGQGKVVDPMDDDEDEVVTPVKFQYDDASARAKFVYLPNDRVKVVFENSLPVELASIIEMSLQGYVAFDSVSADEDEE